MAEESFILVNLKEDKAKKLAQVISNDSCRKILEFLTHNDKATETQLSEKLNIPMSTVHYNLQHLQDSNLIDVEEFHYSQKGKEVNHYKLAKKFIIIAPQDSSPGFIEKLKSILPLGIFAIIGAGLIQGYEWLSKLGLGGNSAMMSKSADFAVQRMVAESAEMAPMAASSPIVNSSASEPNLALWFLAGSIFMMLVVLIIGLIKKK